MATVPSAFFVLEASLLQFARPAVEFNFLLQMMWIPPAEDANAETLPSFMVSSSSLKNDSASSFLFSLKAFRCSAARLSVFDPLLGLFRGDSEGEYPASSSLLTENKLGLLVVIGVLIGEYSSFQSLMTS